MIPPVVPGQAEEKQNMVGWVSLQPLQFETQISIIV